MRDAYKLYQSRSIHPQGWVPIETEANRLLRRPEWRVVAFTPKGGCPLKRSPARAGDARVRVAFTPKGGCPLKRAVAECRRIG